MLAAYLFYQIIYIVFYNIPSRILFYTLFSLLRNTSSFTHLLKNIRTQREEENFSCFSVKRMALAENALWLLHSRQIFEKMGFLTVLCSGIDSQEIPSFKEQI